MKIHIRAPKLKLPKTLSAHVERRLGFALARFGERIDHVILLFSEASAPPDVATNGARRNGTKNGRLNGTKDGKRNGTKNGHRNPVVTRCQIVVSLNSRKVRVEDTDPDMIAAFDRAVHHASRSVARAIEREGWWEAGPPTQLSDKFRVIQPTTVKARSPNKK
jgi:ribosome-associated translation inhibitor RaiA